MSVIYSGNLSTSYNMNRFNTGHSYIVELDDCESSRDQGGFNITSVSSYWFYFHCHAIVVIF